MQNRLEVFRSRSKRVNVALCAAFAGAAAALGTMSLSSVASAQAATAFPFPSAKPTMGLTTGVLTSHELRAQYNLWKELFVERCGQGDARIRYPESGNDTRSEGVGYGMVIAAYFGDQPTFDGLWDFYQRSSPGTGLMHWRRTGCDAGGGGGDTGSASDADIDAAFGLIVANRQWGGYAADAGRVVAAIRTNLFQGGCQGILLAGSTFAACGCINPSYIPPGYYPAFGAADAGQAQFWTTARNNSYTYLAAVSDNNTGLVPAWSQSNGSLNLACPGAPQVSGGGNTNEFQADAARTPWRVAVDYLWTANPSARTFLQDIADFAAAQRIVQIVDRYSLGGQALNGNGDATGLRSTFTMGGFATAMSASTQENLDAFTGAWQSMYLPGDSIGANNVAAPRAFNSSLALLYGLAVTGFMWDPSGAAPTRATEPTLTPPGDNQLENGDFDEGILGWSFANIGAPGTGAEGYAMHRQGELNIRLQRAAASADNAYEVRLNQVVSVQAGQNYRIAFRARADAERPIKVAVQFGGGPGVPYEGFGALGNQRDEEAPVLVGTEMQTYEWVFTSTGTRANANFDIDVGDNIAGLVLDDVFFGPTTLPPSVAGEGAPTDNPVVTPGTPPGGGQGTTPPPGGGIGTVPGQGDVSSTPGGTGTPGGAGVNGAAPAPPSGGLTGATGTCTSDANCQGAKCSPELHLCYDEGTGYVWDSTKNGGAGDWSFPPRYFDQDGDGLNDDDCGVDYVFWPKLRGCYDPVTGYGWNPTTNAWVPIGKDYRSENWGDGGAAADSGCSVSEGAAGGQGQLGLLAGVLGAALALGSRRRSRTQR